MSPDPDIYVPELPDFEFPEISIIAMKGYPYTRKTEFAGIIATSLKYPILSLDEILIHLTPPISSEKKLEAFQGIFRIALQQINKRISKCVVIDSPLSSDSHFIHLTGTVDELFRRGYFKGSSMRVIVIDCVPRYKYSWELMFNERSSNYRQWIKPNSWEEVKKCIEEHPDYDLFTPLSSNIYVSKLVVDPIWDFPLESDGEYHLMNQNNGSTAVPHRLVEAVKYMMTRDRGDGPDVVVFREWLPQFLSSSITQSGKENCTMFGHDIVPDSKAGVPVEGIQQKAVDCMLCGRRVTRSDNMGGSYCYCKNCSLTLHMDCALSSKPLYYPGKRFRQRSWDCLARFTPCMHSDRSMCKACQLDHLLQSRDACPAAIKHSDTKEHFLTVLFLDADERYRCVACGESNSGGNPMYLCKDCGITYHYDCVTMPRQVKDVHGGHPHHLSLKFESQEAEDYICHECQSLRDPALWYYSCEDCPTYESHPGCVAKLRSKISTSYNEWVDRTEIKAAYDFYHEGLKMRESESISDFYSRVIYLIQWYGDLTKEAGLVEKILGSLPLKFYHKVVAIKRSKEYESMTVDQLMISLRLYEKRIDNGEDVPIEQVLANLYATQWSIFRDKLFKYVFNYKYCKGEDDKWLLMNIKTPFFLHVKQGRGGNWIKYWRMYFKGEDVKLIINAKDVSLKSVLRTNYSATESGDNWIKYLGRYWDKYWFNYQRGYYGKHRRQYMSKVQCSICKMFGHYPRRCWSVSKKAKNKSVKIKFLIQSHSSQRHSISQSPTTFSPRSEIEGRVFKD